MFRVMMDDVDIELVSGAQKFLRICCPTSMGWLYPYPYPNAPGPSPSPADPTPRPSRPPPPQSPPQIWHDMYGVKSQSVLPFPKPPLLSSPPPPPRELLWKLPYELKSEVLVARKEFDEACGGYTLDAVEFRDFGKGRCKVCIVSWLVGWLIVLFICACMFC